MGPYQLAQISFITTNFVDGGSDDYEDNGLGYLVACLILETWHQRNLLSF